jgi:hypothetical protein
MWSVLFYTLEIYHWKSGSKRTIMGSSFTPNQNEDLWRGLGGNRKMRGRHNKWNANCQQWGTSRYSMWNYVIVFYVLNRAALYLLEMRNCSLVWCWEVRIALWEVEVVVTHFKLFSQHSSGVNGQYVYKERQREDPRTGYLVICLKHFKCECASLLQGWRLWKNSFGWRPQIMVSLIL